MNLGLIIISITVLGFISNWLNNKYLNFKLINWLYYLGAAIHEMSHAILCVLTGAKITEFKIFSKQPHVAHARSRLPLIGQPLISLAPIAGGLFFIYAINHWLLNNHFTLNAPHNINEIFNTLVSFIAQINLLDWQSWIMIILFINIGAMIGPSTKDLKNIWPILIIMLFINWPALINIGLIAVSLIIINIFLQIIAIIISQFIKLFTRY